MALQRTKINLVASLWVGYVLEQQLLVLRKRDRNVGMWAGDWVRSGKTE